MPKMTVLEIVQDILNSMDSDEVNSINDTVESQQVAQIVKTTFFNIIDGRTWPHLKQMFQLDSSGTIARPTYMKVPEQVVHLDFIKYNCKKSTDSTDKYVEIFYKEPEEFIDILNTRDLVKDNVKVVTDPSSTIPLKILTDKAPTYWTSFDDETVVMDSYDSGVDSTLQNSKTQCHGLVYPTFSLLDDFVPDLPVQAFSYLLAEAKATAFIDLKQTQNPKAEQNSISQRRRMSGQRWQAMERITYPNYGRK